MPSPIEGFDWHERIRIKCAKHGMPLAETEALLRGNPNVAPDARHAHTREPLIAIGRNAADWPLFVAFTIRIRERRQMIRRLGDALERKCASGPADPWACR